MYGKATVTGVAGSSALALTGHPVWGLVLVGLLLIVLGLAAVRAVSVRRG